MTRVEPAPPALPPVAPRFRLPVPRFTLGRLVKLAVVVGIFWVLVQVARTGLWAIPVVSQLAYRAPAPVRTVEPATPSAGDLLARVPAMLTTGTVTVAESELSVLAEQGNQKFRLGFAKVQTVVAESGIELSFLMPQRRNAIVRLDLRPTVTSSGDPDFTVEQARIGALRVPNWFIGEPARRLLQLQLAPAFQLLPPIQNVRTVEGAIVFALTAP